MFEHIWLMIPAFLFAIWAQWKVSSTFRRFSEVRAASGMTGAEVARAILQRAGSSVTLQAGSPQSAQVLNAVRVEAVAGELSDHYDPREQVLRLSEPVYGSTSLAALGVAAHEAGHAIQHAAGYSPLVLRSVLVPAAQIGSNLAFPLVFIGLIMGMNGTLIDIGILLYSAAVLFTLVTLPVEYNASHRAIALLQEGGYIRTDEVASTKAVLGAAGLTYVAAAATAILTLVRLLLIRDSRD